MPDCRQIDPLVTPYVDGQLTDRDRNAVAEHLRVCPPCDWRVRTELAVRNLVAARRHALTSSCNAPGALQSRCTEALRREMRMRDGSERPATAGWRARLVPLALAASLVLIVGAAFLSQLTASSARVMAIELTADHMKCFTLNGVLHTHDDPAAVESSMLSLFGWRMRMPNEIARAGLELVGARPCLYGEGKVAHIMFRHNGRPVSVFMLPRERRTDQVLKVLGHEASIWNDGNRTFVMIARESRTELERLAAFVHASLR